MIYRIKIDGNQSAILLNVQEVLILKSNLLDKKVQDFSDIKSLLQMLQVFVMILMISPTQINRYNYFISST